MKKIWIILGIIAILLIATIVGAYSVLFRDPVGAATLTVKSGTVSVNSGNGFKPISGTVQLNKNDIIQTGADGNAVLILFDSAITQIEPNTQINLASLVTTAPKLKQDAGSTFTKFTGLNGMNTLEIQTPNAVATVRGTAYSVKMDGVRVLEGHVGVRPNGHDEQNISGGFALVLENGNWTNRNLTAEERASLLAQLQQSIDDLKTIRQHIIDHNAAVMNVIKNQFNVSDQQIADTFSAADAGTIDINAMLDQSPIKTPVVIRIAQITTQIKLTTQQYTALSNVNVSQQQ